MFQLNTKYNKITDLTKRILIPAQRELNQSAPYSFIFTQVKTWRKITSLTFTPVYIAKNRDKELETNLFKRK